MELTFIKNTVPVKLECFEVCVAYEHGDADDTDHETYVLPTSSQEDLKKYLEKFKETASAINDMRHYGSELPDWIRKVDAVAVDGTNFSIRLVYDKFTEQSNYYAAMAIHKILFYDEIGQQFTVNVKY